MDDKRFDGMARALAAGRSRRSVLKGLVGLTGGAAVATVAGERADAAWSTLICLPDGSGGYTKRLVPTAAAPFYIQRYNAVYPDASGSCFEEPCPAFFARDGGACIVPCQRGTCEGCDYCGATPSGEAYCLEGDWQWDCDEVCTADTDNCSPCLYVLDSNGLPACASGSGACVTETATMVSCFSSS